MVLNVLLAILLLSVLVIVHEFGHFIIAKANGVAVQEFSIGFGPKLLHFQKGDTEYCLKLLPFGGYCLLLGQDFAEAGTSGREGEEEEKLSALEKRRRQLEEKYGETRSFEAKSVWARIAIIAAGPLFNFLFALILSIIVIGSVGYDPCVIDVTEDNSPATEAGLQVGDRITSVNGEGIAFEREFSFYRYYHAKDTMNLTYVRDGQTYQTTVVPQYTTANAYKIGVAITTQCTITEVQQDSPAQKAGMKANDRILSVNGTELNEGSDLTKMLSETQDQTALIVVDRSGTEVTLEVTPELSQSSAYDVGFTCYGQRVKAAPLQTVGYAFREVGYWIKTVVRMVGMMFTGQVSVNNLSGPVGTVSAISNVVEESKTDGAFYVMLNMFNFGIMLSANLGVINLLPLPALDGGRLIFLLIEAVRGKKVKREHEGIVNFVGMILLMLLMFYVLFKDIASLF